MDEALQREFLTFSADKLLQLARRIENCLGQLTEEQVWGRNTDGENAVGNLVLHLSGNVRQWIVAGVGDKPDIRDRDAEFTARGGVAKADLAARLLQIVEEAAQVIRAVTADRLAQRVVIQKYDVTVMEAIYHVVEHFSQHTGQIIFVTKMLTGSDLGFYRHLKTPSPHGEKTP